MIKYKVMYSSQALLDIKSIYDYISKKLYAPQSAKNQVNRIRKEIRALDILPTRYSLVEWEPWASMQMHKLPVNNYIVFYIVDEQKQNVNIIRIVYGGRNLEKLAELNR